MVKLIEETGEKFTTSDTAKLAEDISSLYLNQKFSDVTLIVDGHKVFAHKAILAVRSEYFETLLYHGLQANQPEVTITDISPEAFQIILKYIYTGEITVSPNSQLCLEVLGLAHQHSFKNLELAIMKKTTLNQKNICEVLNMANLYDLDELRNDCHQFIDKNASQIITNDCLNILTQKSMINLLQRDTFFVPEIEIFKIVSKWCETNNDVDKLVIQCVRFSWLTVVEIVSIVWPSKLLDCESLLQAIAEIVGVKAKTSNSRGLRLIEENIATPGMEAEVTSGVKTYQLLTGNRNVEQYAYHPMDGKSNITIKLKNPYYFNYIQMMFWDSDTRYYSYYIEVSVDQKKWLKVIDYSRYSCRSYQNLYFEQVVAQYVRIVGTHTNTDDTNLYLVFVEIYFKNNIPKIQNGIINPSTNVATLDKKAIVLQGVNPTYLLNGDTKNYDGSIGYTYHSIGGDSIIVQLAQPYMISSMKLLLWDHDSRAYRYFIETSVNKSDWKIAADRRNEDCKSWQILHFDERPVVFVKITGTHNTNNNNKGFHVVHFECPASPDNK